jgi:hypothetical protein
MSLTRFKMPNGADLSTVFEPLNGGTMYATPTGFIIYSTGQDLREVFAVNTSYTIENDTKLIAQNGIDLRYIFQGVEPPLLVTITGTGTYTQNITGNKYTYTFTNGTNTISINKPISELYAIVVGGGGAGGRSTGNGVCGGGGGGGFGFVGPPYVGQAYVSNTVYNVIAGTTAGLDGLPSSFINSTTGNGVTSTGGARGITNNTGQRAISGTCSNTGNGTLTLRTGGTGGAKNDTSGTNSSGSITVLGVTYNYSGGGACSANLNGGKSGKNGIGGSGTTTTIDGENGTSATPGGGGGGGAGIYPAIGGNGSNGRVVVIFTYP